MDNEKEMKELLERIADALETIANCLSNGSKTSQKKNNKHNINEEFSDNFINDFSEIEEFLRSKNISIKSVREEDEADKVLDRIALFMGNRYSNIKNLYQKMKKNLNEGTGFRLDLKNHKQEEIADITQLCNNLYEIAFLEEYKYFKSPKYILQGKVNKIPKAINFLNGGWLERYIKSAVIEIIKSISNPIPLNYSYLKNPQIILPNGDYFELDIIFKIENEYFWFEAKTGDYQRYIHKYSKVAEILDLDFKHAYMILTDITKEGAEALRGIFKMTVVRIDDFYDMFTKSILSLKPENDKDYSSKAIDNNPL